MHLQCRVEYREEATLASTRLRSFPFNARVSFPPSSTHGGKIGPHGNLRLGMETTRTINLTSSSLSETLGSLSLAEVASSCLAYSALRIVRACCSTVERHAKQRDIESGMG